MKGDEKMDEMIKELDIAIERSIQKFRDGKTGADVRAFVAEYEELMYKKSQLLADMYLKNKLENGKIVNGTITVEHLDFRSS